MPIKKIDSGIFTEYHISECTTEREWQRAIKNGQSLRGLDARLKNLETLAERISGGISNLSGVERDLVPEALKLLRVSKGDLQRSDLDACRVLELIRRVRYAVEQGNAERAADVGIELGKIAMKMLVRPYEKRARAGRASLANLGKGRQRGVDRYNDARERHRDWKEYADMLSPRHSARSIARLIAFRFGVKPDTVRRALRNLH